MDSWETCEAQRSFTISAGKTNGPHRYDVASAEILVIHGQPAEEPNVVPEHRLIRIEGRLEDVHMSVPNPGPQMWRARTCMLRPETVWIGNCRAQKKTSGDQYSTRGKRRMRNEANRRSILLSFP